MLQLQDLKNLQIFMNRVQVTGQEAIAWVQAVSAIGQEIADRETPKVQGDDK